MKAATSVVLLTVFASTACASAGTISGQPQALPGAAYREDRIEILSADAWVVWLDLELEESVRGMTIKRTTIRYPLRVVRLAVDPETNPWGLALDGFAGDGPERLVASAESAHSAAAATKEQP